MYKIIIVEYGDVLKTKSNYVYKYDFWMFLII